MHTFIETNVLCTTFRIQTKVDHSPPIIYSTIYTKHRSGLTPIDGCFQLNRKSQNKLKIAYTTRGSTHKQGWKHIHSTAINHLKPSRYPTQHVLTGKLTHSICPHVMCFTIAAIFPSIMYVYMFCYNTHRVGRPAQQYRKPPPDPPTTITYFVRAISKLVDFVAPPTETTELRSDDFSASCLSKLCFPATKRFY